MRVNHLERRIRLANIARGPRQLMDNAYDFDRAYDDLFVEPGRELGTVLLDDVEPAGPKGLITGTTAVIRDTARVISASENGLVRTYAFGIVAGLALAGVVLAIVVAGAS
jgi:hypothetical protein